ncbi:signal peptide peptidase SppA [Fusobacterium sp. MFO224]|uniref:signal peptide peptidase SppA n=1 Tax=Fusobacterium sp. MFO224 TaxID=3378070 RepID=UPI003854401E
METLKKILKGLKNFFKHIFVEMGKAFFKLIILGLVILGVTKYIKNQQKLPPIENKTYVVIDMPRTLGESKIKTLLDLNKEENFYEFLKELNIMKDDKRVKGLILKLNNYGLNRAQTEELKVKLRELKKEGKRIYAYLEEINNVNYSLALEARNIIVPDTNFLVSDISGYNGTFPYYKELGDNLGLEAEIIHIGDFKSYGENYRQNHMSKEFKENTKRIYDRLYENYVGDIARKRQVDKDKINDKILSGDFVMSSGNTLKNNKLVDEVIYYEDFLVKNEINNYLSRSEYLTRYYEEKKLPTIPKKEKLAIVYLEGNIVLNENSKNVEKIITPKSVKEKLKIIEKDKEIKGIVLRINSSGGSALASDLIYKSLKEFEKPIYVSMGGVAASGGYFISAAGDKIYADKETITGSIGVVTIIPNASKLMEKVGINFETLTNNKHDLDMGIYRKISPEMKNKIYNSSMSSYNEFLTKMSTSRKMKISDIEKIAGGRVWLGSEAKEIGLVDEIGGLEKAIDDLAKELKLEDYKVVEAVKNEKIESLLKTILPKYIFRDLMGDNLLVKEFGNMEEFKLQEELLNRPVLYAPETKF